MAETPTRHFQLLGRLGSGGMAEVFLARQVGPGGFERLTVVKRILPTLEQDQEAAELLRREARVCALLSHPNVVHLYDFDEIDGAGYLIMEPVDGPSLAELLSRSPTLPKEIAAYVIAEAAQGLHAAHELRDPTGRPLKLVHRDVSPENLLLSWAGQVKVADFGIALSNIGPRITRTGSVRGKPAYMSPEQMRGLPVDQRADVYSLGAVLYELLSGKPPFDRPTDVEIMAAAMATTLPPLPGGALANEAMRALSRDIADRHPSAMHLSYRLRAAAPGGSASLLARYLEKYFPADDSARSRFRRALGTPRASQRSGTRRMDAADGEVAQAPSFEAADVASTSIPEGGPREELTEAAAQEATQKHQTVPKLARSRVPMALAISAVAIVVCIVAYAALGSRPKTTVSLPATTVVTPPTQQAPTLVAASETTPPPAPRAVEITPERTPEVAAKGLRTPSPVRSERSTKPVHEKAPAALPEPPPPLPPAGGAIALTSDPACDLTVDGAVVGRGHATASELAAGLHEVRCHDNANGIDVSMKVNLAPGEQRTIDIAPGKGTLTVKVAPWGRVFVDGKDLGLTPIAPFAVFEGRHHVEAVRPGKRAEELVIVPRDGEIEVRLRLD
jgi:eukaryotic-like serine/threonine-protein kinase